MHSAKYALIAGVAFSGGIFVITSSNAARIVSISSGLELGMRLSPYCPLRAASLHRTAEQRDELATSHHSITSSAATMSLSGTVKLRALAVLRLITNSNLVGCTTGKSVGVSPARMRPV